MSGRTPRSGHPDDALRRLARTGRPTLGPANAGRRPPQGPSAMRQFNLAAVAVLSVLTAIVLLPYLLPKNRLTVTGIKTKSYLKASAVNRMAVKIKVSPAKAVAGLDVRLDGQIVPIKRYATYAIWKPDPATLDGPHTLVIRSGSSMLWRGPTTKSYSFVIDRQRPTLQVRSRRNVDGQALVIEGSVEMGVALRVNGLIVPIQKDGTFRAAFRRAPIGTVEIVATDSANNQTRRLVRTRSEKDKIRAVHVTARGWKLGSVRKPVLRMAANSQINAVMLTLKDEDGQLAYASTVPKAVAIGASQDVLDLRATVAELHANGIRVIGRIVTFRDPLYVANAVAAKQLDRVVTDASGLPYQSADGTFANPASPDAQQYILDLLAEVSATGIDDVILDDVRRPDGILANLRMPGVEPTSTGLTDTLVAFIRRAGAQLRGANVGLGVTVMGASIEDPQAFGQNVNRLAPVVDYLSPKLFPSRFPSGAFGISDPGAAPHRLVAKALISVFRQAKSTDAGILPFLQDFSEGRPNGPADVRAQIDATDELGIGRWVLVDPKMSYNTGGIPKKAKPILGGAATTTTTIAISP